MLGLWPRSWCAEPWQASPLFQLTETFLLQEVLELAFSILYDPDETLNFIAPNKYEVSSRGTALHRRAAVILQLEGRSVQNRNVLSPEGQEAVACHESCLTLSICHLREGPFPLSWALQVTLQRSCRSSLARQGQLGITFCLGLGKIPLFSVSVWPPTQVNLTSPLRAPGHVQ